MKEGRFSTMRRCSCPPFNSNVIKVKNRKVISRNRVSPQPKREERKKERKNPHPLYCFYLIPIRAHSCISNEGSSSTVLSAHDQEIGPSTVFLVQLGNPIPNHERLVYRYECEWIVVVE